MKMTKNEQNTTETSNTIELADILKAIPAARAIFRDSVIVGLSSPVTDNEPIFFRTIKPLIVATVGAHAGPATPAPFRTAEAYDTLYQACLEAVNCHAVYLDLCLRARRCGYKPGWVWHAFKAKFGVFPKFNYPAKMRRAEERRRRAMAA